MVGAVAHKIVVNTVAAHRTVVGTVVARRVAVDIGVAVVAHMAAVDIGVAVRRLLPVVLLVFLAPQRYR